MVPQTSQLGGAGGPEGLWATSDWVLHCRQRSVVVGLGGLLGLAFHDLAAGREQVGLSHVFMRGAILVSERSSASLPMCLSSRLCRVLILEMEGRDHCVLPAVKGVLGLREVKWGEEWVWLLLRAAYGAVRVSRFVCEVADLAALIESLDEFAGGGVWGRSLGVAGAVEAGGFEREEVGFGDGVDSFGFCPGRVEKLENV